MQPGKRTHAPKAERFHQRRGDGRTDLYAVDCVLYELLVSRPPFVGDAAGVMYNHLHDEPLRPRDAEPACPPDVVAGQAVEQQPRVSARPTSSRSVSAEATGTLSGRRYWRCQPGVMP
ncbi:hypothetical protein [Streptomyces flaveus]|uniref:hypothetical protein n=1 Tax=Streptomyces flaveus TaxID=66370 RepID=UPI0033297361